MSSLTHIVFSAAKWKLCMLLAFFSWVYRSILYDSRDNGVNGRESGCLNLIWFFSTEVIF